MINNYRYFKVYKLNNKLVDFGRVKISYESGKPLDSAKKLLSSICRHEGITNKLKCKAEFFIKETTTDSKKKIYGPYKGSFKKYDKPFTVKLKDGTIIKHIIYPHVYKLKSKSIVQKGGDSNTERELISKLEKLIMDKRSNNNYIINIIVESINKKDILYNKLNYLFQWCVHYNRLDVAKSILNIDNFHINSITNDGYTYLIIYCKIRNNDSDNAKDKQYNVVKLLLDNGAMEHIDYQDYGGNTALHYAVIGKNTKLVKLLLDKGANVNIINNLEHTPLISSILCKYDNTEIVKLLLDKGANINRKDSDGITALHHASSLEYIGIIELLIENGADVNIKNNNGQTVLMHIVSNRNSNKNIPIVELVLQKDANIDIKDNRGMTALMYAVYQENTEIVKLLLKYGAKVNIPNNQGKSALNMATEKGYTEIAKLLYNQSNIEKLYNYISAQNTNSFKKLLDEVVNVNIQYKNGMTLLMWVSKSGNPNMAELLLDKGADVNIQDSNGETSLHHAALRKDSEIIKLLIENGADVNIKNNYGNTALSIALSISTFNNQQNTQIVKKLLLIVKLLLQNGATFNTTNKAINKILKSNPVSNEKIEIKKLIVNQILKS